LPATKNGKMSAKVYLLLGSNMNNPELQLQKAKAEILQSIGEILESSSCYATAPWGNTNQSHFINQVVKVNTTLNPLETMQTILSIEEKLGRIRTEKNAPRAIDIDILFFNKEIVDVPNLQIPHPHIQDRNFVLIPLNEIAPSFVHPVLQKNIHELMKACKDKLAVDKI
jgi:2-amino-4-hydroxy-6-hydroxymethyldihydropteridine diphosphokinase